MITTPEPSGKPVTGQVRLVAAVVLRRQPRTQPWEETVCSARLGAIAVIRERWAQISAAMLGYVVLQFLLLWCSLEVAGAACAWPVAMVSFAVERVLTLVPGTPGGSGLAEAGSVAVLVALGADPLGAAAGVLLYRLFVFALEIPVGGILLSAWLVARGRVAGGRQ